MNLRPLISRLSVVNKQANLVPFVLNREQDIFVDEVEGQMGEGKPVRIIVLKARQMGISTVSEAIMFSMAFIYDRLRAMVVAHEIDSSQHLLSIADTYWQSYPFRTLYTPKYASKNELAWKETGSSIKVATARNAKAGRGRTIHALHGSEVGFWEEAETTMLGLRQTVPQLPGTFICLESTANGVGNYFYQMWMAAEAGDVDYVPLFFPWHNFPEYTASFIGLPYHSLGALDGEERALKAMGLSDDRLGWRRWAIKNLADNDIHKFHQEYPTSPEEAFIATGTNVFPIAKLRECYKPKEGIIGRLTREGSSVRFQPDIAGPLRVFSTPSKDSDWGKYFVAGDPTHSTRGDYACAQVLQRRTNEQVAVYRARLDPSSFAEELAKLGTFYNDAMLTTEVEGPGYATVGRLIEIDYPQLWFNKVADTTQGKTSDHVGWRTTMKSKELAIGWLLKAVVDNSILIHDRQTFHEMRDYVTLPGGGYGNAGGSANDDTVMALSIALTCHMLDGPMMPYTGPGSTRDQQPNWETWGEMEGTG